MTDPDSIFDFTGLRHLWIVSVKRPSERGEMGAWQIRNVQVEAKDVHEACEKAHAAFPGWVADGVQNCEEMAARSLAEDIAWIWRD